MDCKQTSLNNGEVFAEQITHSLYPPAIFDGYQYSIAELEHSAKQATKLTYGPTLHQIETAKEKFTQTLLTQNSTLSSSLTPLPKLQHTI
jgi:hypothetical protein